MHLQPLHTWKRGLLARQAVRHLSAIARTSPARNVGLGHNP